VFEIQAHRANDPLSLRRHVSARPTSVEVDVAVTTDGAVVASHELRATTVECGETSLVGVPWRVLTLEQAQRLGRIPLDVVLAAAGESRVVVEAKSAPPQTVAANDFARALAPYLARIELASFDERVLAAARWLHTAVDTTFLFERPLRIATAAPTIGPRYDLVDAELVHAAHALGRRVVPWTVNDAPTMSALAALGVDGLVTDDPALAREAVGGLVELAA